MTRRKPYHAESKREALRRANVQGVTDRSLAADATIGSLRRRSACYMYKVTALMVGLGCRLSSTTPPFPVARLKWLVYWPQEGG